MSEIASKPVTVRLPESIRRRAEELAVREGITLEQFIASATGEKLAVWMSLDWLRDEAAAGRREDLERFLAAVPDVEPAETDRLPGVLEKSEIRSTKQIRNPNDQNAFGRTGVSNVSAALRATLMIAVDAPNGTRQVAAPARCDSSRIAPISASRRRTASRLVQGSGGAACPGFPMTGPVGG